MKIVTLLIFITVVSFELCNGQELENDPLIREYFGKEEVQKLEKIVGFFDQHVKQTCATDQSLSACYNQYLENLTQVNVFANQTLTIGISIETQSKFLESLDNKYLNNIWWYGPEEKHLEKDSIHRKKELQYNSEGSYVGFLKALAQEDDKFAPYIDTYGLAGSISPSMVSYFLKNYKMFNISSERDRLILAIHYLTVNSSEKDKD